MSKENLSVKEWLQKEADKIRADHSYNLAPSVKAQKEFIENLRNKPELVEKLDKALTKKEKYTPCIISPNGFSRWDHCPHHKNSGGEHGWGFCIYRTDYDIMQTKDRLCKFKKPEEKLPEELFEI